MTPLNFQQGLVQPPVEQKWSKRITVQWRPHHLCAAAAVFYSAKSRQDCGLVGHTSRDGPDNHWDWTTKYLLNRYQLQDSNLEF